MMINRKSIGLFFIVMGLFLPVSIVAEGTEVPIVEAKWKKTLTFEASNNYNAITIYTRKIAGQALKQFKGVTIVDAPINDIAALMIDLGNHPNWIYNTKSSQMIDGSDGKRYYYIQIKAPSPVKDRDAVVDTRLTTVPSTKEVIIKNFSAPNGVYPQQKKHVRMTNLASEWHLLPLTADKTQVTFIGHADPGGWVPIWVANLVVTDMPRVTLKNMYQQVKKAKYHNVQLKDIASDDFDISPLFH